MKIKSYYRLVELPADTGEPRHVLHIQSGWVEPRHVAHDMDGRVLGIGEDTITLHGLGVEGFREHLEVLAEAATLPVLKLSEHPIMPNDALFDLEG